MSTHMRRPTPSRDRNRPAALCRPRGRYLISLESDPQYVSCPRCRREIVRRAKVVSEAYSIYEYAGHRIDAVHVFRRWGEDAGKAAADRGVRYSVKPDGQDLHSIRARDHALKQTGSRAYSAGYEDGYLWWLDEIHAAMNAWHESGRV